MSESPPALDLLLDTIRRAQQRGEVVRARAVARLLTQQYPQALQAWQALADLAEHDAEREVALLQVLALSPLAEPVALADEPALPPQQPSDTTTLTPVELTSTMALEARASRMRWPILLVGCLAILAILGLLAWRQGLFSMRAQGMFEPSPVAQPTTIMATLIPTAVSIPEDLPTAAPLPPGGAAATNIIQPTQQPSATPLPTLGPTSTPRPILPIGRVVEQAGWTISLLRPTDAMLLEGSIGNLQPHGRFALALVAVANSGDVAAKLPDGLVTLVDAAGNSYAPSLDASAAYLNTYGRGQVGDLSLNEAVPPNAGNVSIPLIFDVPPTARDLYLVVAGASQGWPIADSR